MPQGTASFALLCAHLDAPRDRSRVNQAGTMLPDDIPRCEFYHWVVVDLPLSVHEIEEGAFVLLPQDGAAPMLAAPLCRLGYNDYADMPEVSAAMGQRYGAPAPPWNDTRAHRYCFTVYALSIPRLALPDRFKARDVLHAMQGQVLDQASLTAVYTLNSSLAALQVGSPSVT